mgnify:CR=1 FL=1
MLWLTFLKAFAVGGAICLIGQIIINWTHLTNGKILVIFLLAGAVLQGFGVYAVSYTHLTLPTKLEV